MRAVVLVGGLGTRLRPLTYTIPKPMLPVLHVPIIERLIANLVRGGVDEVVLALGFKPEPFLEAYPGGVCAGARLTYAVEPEAYDTAGAIRFAAEFAGIDETFVVANGDILTGLDIAALVDFHRRAGVEGTIHTYPVADPSSFGVVATDAAGIVEAFVEKPAPGTAPSNQINAGTYVLEPEVLARIEPGRKVSIERVTFPAMVADRALAAMPSDVYWIDTGRPELYLQANLDALVDPAVSERPVSPGADVGPSASIETSVIAAGAVVGRDARISRSVILPGARIGAGAVVLNSVVAGELGERSVLEDCVIGASGRVAAGTSFRSIRLPAPDAS